MNRISQYKYPQLWAGCVAAYCPSVDQRKGTTLLSDQSGRQNHGTLTNMASPGDNWVISNGKTALDFDGTNDYAAVVSPTQNTGRLVDTLLDFSMSFWAYQRSTASETFAVGVGNTTNDLQHLGFGQWGSSPVQFRMRGTDGSVGAINVGIAINDVPHHIVCLRRGATMELFADGKMLNTATIPGTYTLTQNTFHIGALQRSTLLAYWNGTIDDIRIYKRALSPSEIKLLAIRRGIAYETNATKVTRFGSLSGAATRSRNYLVGAF